MYRTSAQWRERGYLIRTGSRSHARNQWGTALFNSAQVRRMDQVAYVPRGTMVIYT